MATSRRVEVGFGQVAVAPRVDDPQGFAVHNLSGERLFVTFSYDTVAHIQTVHIESAQATKAPPDEAASAGGNMPAGDA